MLKLNPQDTYISLGPDGIATPLLGGDAFWQLPHLHMGQAAGRWLVSEYLFDADWPSWEMHPHADEFVYLLSGEAQLHIQHDHGVEIVELCGGQAVLVPRAKWHTAKIAFPSRMLHITLGAGTQTKPV